MAGVVGGTLLSIGLVLVSPNMTYPLMQKEAALATVTTVNQQLVATSDPALRDTLTTERATAQATADTIPANATSVVGLSKPLISLRNPGIISIPLGFLLVILFSLFTRSALSESKWVEMSVRRETGLGVAQATVH